MAWTGGQESLIPVLCLILICCVTLGKRRPLSGHWTPQNSRTYQLQQPTVYHPRSVSSSSADPFLIICWWIIDKKFLSPAHFLSTQQASGLSLLGQMVCVQEFQTNFNIQSNIIGIINLKKEKQYLTTHKHLMVSFSSSSCLKILGSFPSLAPEVANMFPLSC